jgi:hypothetical protein
VALVVVNDSRATYTSNLPFLVLETSVPATVIEPEAKRPATYTSSVGSIARESTRSLLPPPHVALPE